MDGNQHKRLTLFISSFMALGALVGVVAYIENRKIKKMQGEMLVLDGEIKELELAFKQHRNDRLGILT